jgi:Tol biopolymer transport system component
MVLLLGTMLTACSVIRADNQSNGASLYPPISYDGRYVAFYSLATNLVPGDTNNAGDIFIHDRVVGETTRVSVNSAGREGDLESIWPSLSGDARYIAFTSSATNLVPNDTNNVPDVFVHDRDSGITTRISVSSRGEQSDGVSYNYFPAITADGRYVTFASIAGNLVEDDTNEGWDVFVHDLRTKSTIRVSVDSEGRQANAPSLHPVISGDGRFVAFNSYATNLITGDANEVSDVFVHDLETRTTAPVSVDQQGRLGNAGSDRATISFDGECIGYSSFASNLTPVDRDADEDVFIYERTARNNRLASNSVGITPAVARDDDDDDVPWCCYISPACCIIVVISDRKSVIAPDGNSIIYRYDAPDLVPDDTNFRQDIFMYDRNSDKITRISVNSQGEEANGDSVHHGLSFDGRYVAFSSEATNLVPNDTNGVSDIFVYDRETGETTRVSVSSTPKLNAATETPTARP